MRPTFSNPLNLAADPWIVYFDGNYYLTTTQTDCIRMWKAPTLGGLADAPGIVVWQDADPTRSLEMWAAEFYRIGTRWYMYYTASDGYTPNHRIFVLESAGDDPLGPYHFKAQMTDTYSIDPNLLDLGDGRRFFLYTSCVENRNALVIAPLVNPYTLGEPHALISVPTYDWETRGFPVNEAPEALVRSGRVFVIYSACDTGTPDYCLGMLSARADAHLLDPASWTKAAQPVFTRCDERGVYGVGHNGFFKSPDGTEDWIIYHAKTTPEYTYGGRTTRAQPFTWNADGTPNFGTPLALETPVSAPAGES